MILVGNFFIHSYKTRAPASSKAQRNAVAAQISPKVNILTREKIRGVCVCEFSISFRGIW